MTRLMIIVGSVREGRVGLAIAEWVREQAGAFGFDVDFVDLKELALPFMDEPNHPRQRRYTKPHTLAWSERVDTADAFVLVTPEYNHSYAAPLKNALDYLNQEWWRKPVGFVSYGGVSSGTRGVVALEVVTAGLGMVRVGANVEISFPGQHIVDGVFQPGEKESAILTHELEEIEQLAGPLTALRAANAAG